MKKKLQLGINPSTAQARLIRDVLYKYAKNSGDMTCYHCQMPIDRSQFSIEHKEPWLDSDDPVKHFFDLENIAFSHLSCNVKVARKPTKGNKTCGNVSGYQTGCRCDLCKKAKAVYAKSRYTTENRQAQYIKYRS